MNAGGWADYENLFTRQTISNQPCLLRLEYDYSDNVDNDCSDVLWITKRNLDNYREIVFNTTYEDDDGWIELRGAVERNENQDIPKINLINLWTSPAR
ncbi:25134_t:CDS:2 [Cetraspora pellucida]|uniref:25134_t:CDS:1 n=1 Tax=Cetraspora pellucida TaxID=1433469 RepID=A0A9N9FB63_9GLOM|nr:25134_t:CDS:2 [Cetraspora pellucida]